MNAQHAGLVTVLRTLNAMTPEETLYNLALRLQIASGLGAVGDLPRAQDAGGKAARHELETVAHKSADLTRLLLDLHSDALRAFEQVDARGDLHPLILQTALKDFALAAMRAVDKVSDAPPHRGNRPRVQPRQVARLARDIYEHLTGRKASRATDPYRNGKSGGPFLAFLSNIYAELKIQTSADSQIKLLQSSPRGKNTRKQIV